MPTNEPSRCSQVMPGRATCGVQMRVDYARKCVGRAFKLTPCFRFYLSRLATRAVRPGFARPDQQSLEIVVVVSARFPLDRFIGRKSNVNFLKHFGGIPVVEQLLARQPSDPRYQPSALGLCEVRVGSEDEPDGQVLGVYPGRTVKPVGVIGEQRWRGSRYRADDVRDCRANDFVERLLSNGSLAEFPFVCSISGLFPARHTSLRALLWPNEEAHRPWGPRYNLKNSLCAAVRCSV